MENTIKKPFEIRQAFIRFNEIDLLYADEKTAYLPMSVDDFEKDSWHIYDTLTEKEAVSYVDENGPAETYRSDIMEFGAECCFASMYIVDHDFEETIYAKFTKFLKLFDGRTIELHIVDPRHATNERQLKKYLKELEIRKNNEYL